MILWGSHTNVMKNFSSGLMMTHKRVLAQLTSDYLKHFKPGLGRNHIAAQFMESKARVHHSFENRLLLPQESYTYESNLCRNPYCIKHQHHGTIKI